MVVVVVVVVAVMAYISWYDAVDRVYGSLRSFMADYLLPTLTRMPKR